MKQHQTDELAAFLRKALGVKAEAMQDGELIEFYETQRARVNSVALEALQKLFARLPWGMDIELADGRKVVLTKFIERRLGKETGDPEFVFDLKGDDWHLEFFVTQTGWESPRFDTSSRSESAANQQARRPHARQK